MVASYEHFASSLLPTNINVVKGWPGTGPIDSPPNNNNKTQEDCRQLALNSGGKYEAWGHRNSSSYWDPYYRNSCVLYKAPFSPFLENNSDNIITSGCLKENITVSMGCKPVNVFEHCGYTGKVLALDEGNYNKSIIKGKNFPDKSISSIKVNSGYSVTLYEDDNYAGKYKEIIGPKEISCINDFNDRTSSIKIKKQTVPLPNDINVVKGWSGAHVNPPNNTNKSQEDCRQLALNSGGKYVAWGHRNSSHWDPNYRDSCFLYTAPFMPYDGNNSDSVHVSGCLNPGEEVKWGCKPKLKENVDVVKGWSGAHVNPPDNKNKIPEDCRQLALNSGGKYVAWGHRNSSHSDPNYRNTCFLYTAPFAPYTGNNNDNVHISGCITPGLKVERGCKNSPCVLYEHCDYKGWGLDLEIGDYTLKNLTDLKRGFIDNQVSSLQVTEGYEVTLYEHDKFQGLSKTYTGPINVPCIVDFNDVTTSISVAKIPTVQALTKISSFSDPVSLKSNPPTHPGTKECAVYFTQYPEECDKGAFSLTDSELKNNYGTTQATSIINERNKLNNTKCKISFNNWYRTMDSPLINTNEAGIKDRGDPSTWAYCYQPLSEQSLTDVKNETQNTTSFNIDNNSYSLFEGINLSYARLAFKNFDFTSLTKDACITNKKYNNKDLNINIPDGDYLVILLNNRKIVYIDAFKKTIEKSLYTPTESDRMAILRKLYEEVLDETNKNKLLYRPKTVSATIYVAGKDDCNNDTLMISSGQFNLQDFGIIRKTLYLYNSNDIVTYGGATTAELNSKGADVKNIINTNINNTINEQFPKNILGKQLHDKFPSSLISPLFDGQYIIMRIM